MPTFPYSGRHVVASVVDGLANVETSVAAQRVDVEYNPHAVAPEELTEIIREKDLEVSEATPGTVIFRDHVIAMTSCGS